MAAILLANEIGGGLGHLLPWSRTLGDYAAGGRDIALAGPWKGALPLPDAWGRVQGLPFPGIPEPVAGGGARALSWPDMLVGLGYARRDQVQALFLGWQELLRTHAPEMVIADHAPLALWAAKDLGIPVVEAGAGFCLPPARRPMPPFPLADATPAAKAASQAAEQELLRAWRQLPARRFTIDNLADLFEGHARCVCSVAELDPYGTRTDVAYTGPLPAPLHTGPATEVMKWWSDGPGDILAYLKLSTPGLDRILRALQATGRQALAIVPGINVDRIRGRLRVTGSVEPLHSLLQSAHLFLTNGGIHGVGLALQAGVPVLAVPMHVEQRLTAERLVRHGWGSMWHPDLNAQTLEGLLQRKHRPTDLLHVAPVSSFAEEMNTILAAQSR